MIPAKNRIVIIGGGIAGLVAANEIESRIQEENLPYTYVVLETHNKVGGHFETIKMDAYYLDLSTSYLDIRDRSVVDYIKKLNLEQDVEGTDSSKPDIFLYNKFYPISYPSFAGVPMKARDIFKQKVLTPERRLGSYFRMLFAFVAKSSDTERSAIDYLYEKYGEYVTEYLIKPILWEEGYGDFSYLTVKDIQPVLLELGNPFLPCYLNKDLFEKLDDKENLVSFTKGMQYFVEALSKPIVENIRVNKSVSGISVYEDLLLLDFQQKEMMRAGGVIVSVSADHLSTLFDDSVPNNRLQSVRCVALGTAIFKFHKEDIIKYPSSYGFVIPQRSEYFISKVTILNRIWKSMNDAPYIYLQVQFGRKGEDRFIDLNEDVIYDFLLEELKDIMGITSKPLDQKMKRWTSSIPHDPTHYYSEVGSLEKVLSEKMPTVLLSHNGIDGYGVMHSIQEGRRMAEEIIDRMKQRDKREASKTTTTI